MSSLIFRKSRGFRRLKYSKIKGLRLKNQTVCYNQTGRLNTPGFYSLMGLPVLTGNETATIEQLEMQTTSTKKAPEGANLINGGNDEARTRDLMRDRHAL